VTEHGVAHVAGGGRAGLGNRALVCGCGHESPFARDLGPDPHGEAGRRNLGRVCRIGWGSGVSSARHAH
jgi:hypothetical protein